MPEANDTAAATTEATPQADDKTQTTAAESKVTPDPKEEVVELDLSGIEKVNGEYVFKDPNNPEKTLYRGKTPGELVNALMKGVAEKDKYISKLKAEGGINVTKHATRGVKGDEDSDDPAIEFPKPQDVVKAVADEFGLDLAVLGWDRAKWQEYERENGVSETIDLKEKVKSVRGASEAKIAAGNVDAMNRSTLLDEENEIRELVAESGVEMDSIDWEKVLSDAVADKKNYYKSGIRKSGAIVKAASAAIAKSLRAEREDKIAEKVEREIAEGKRKARKLTSDGAPAAPSSKTSTKEPAKTTNQAYERALAAFKD